MNTLILNGSPRPQGDTAGLIGVVRESLRGEARVLNAYRCDISPCVDCRYCWENPGCAIDDSMQEVYAYIQECDNILIASPIYFSELTGKLLDVAGRLQGYFCARHFRGVEPVPKPKKGAVILVGGGDGSMEKAYDTACTLLRHMNCQEILGAVVSHNTNRQPAVQDMKATQGARGHCGILQRRRIKRTVSTAALVILKLLCYNTLKWFFAPHKSSLCDLSRCVSI